MPVKVFCTFISNAIKIFVMKKILPLAAICLITQIALHAQNNCDSLLRTYGADRVTSKMFATNNGDYLFAGTLEHDIAFVDSVIYLQEVDSCGDKAWKTALATYPGYYYAVKDFDRSAEGNVFAVVDIDSSGGQDTHKQIHLLKINAAGQTQWTSNYGDFYDDILSYAVCATKDGGALTGGWRGSFAAAPPHPSMLVKFKNTGEVKWANSYGRGTISSIRQVSDGYVFIRAKWRKSKVRTYLHKTDLQGNKIWTVETPPYTKNKYNDPYASGSTYVLPQPDGGFAVVRSTNPGFYPNIVYLSKYNNAGTELWTKTYNYLSYQLVNSIHNTKDSGYILGAFYNDKDSFGIYVMRLDKNGNTVFTKKVTRSHIDYIDSTKDVYTFGADAYELAANKYAVGGRQQTNVDHRNHTGIRTASLLIKFVMPAAAPAPAENKSAITGIKIYKASSQQLLRMFPNPAADVCTIEITALKTHHAQLQIVDLNGKTLRTISLNYLQKTIQLNVHDFASGIYRINLWDRNVCTASAKLLIVR